jgi:hypothetical protein
MPLPLALLMPRISIALRNIAVVKVKCKTSVSRCVAAA